MKYEATERQKPTKDVENAGHDPIISLCLGGWARLKYLSDLIRAGEVETMAEKGRGGFLGDK